MQILVDADALPGAVRDLLLRAAEREQVPLIMVANQPLRIPPSQYIKSLTVAAGPDVADDRIVELVTPGDLVITADIPLADRVVSKGALALNPRGEVYSDTNIKDRLAMRNLMDELRSGGVISGGPAPFTKKERQQFANQLNNILCQTRKNRG